MVFSPYSYLVDPVIRRALDISAWAAWLVWAGRINVFFSQRCQHRNMGWLPRCQGAVVQVLRTLLQAWRGTCWSSTRRTTWRTLPGRQLPCTFQHPRS